MTRLVVLLAFLLAACGGGPDLPPIDASGSGAQGYRLGPDDMVRVIVYDQPELTGSFAVGDDGTIALPLAGSVKVAGLTPGQVAQEVSETLKREQLVRNPSVSIEVERYRPFFILGEVRRPGQYSYVNDMTILEAISIAGGFSYRANQNKFEVARRVNGQLVRGSGTVQTKVLPGDTITVYERFF